MILLKATTEIIRLITSSVADIDYSVSYADITTTTFAPSTSEGKITTATTTTILAAPAASTQRQVKFISITNRHASTANTVRFLKDISGTQYYLTTSINLLAGESVQYVDGQGWVYISSTGAIKADQTAAGTTNQIQFNNGGVLNGDPGLTYDPTTDKLSLLTSGATIDMSTTTYNLSPTTPPSDTLTLFARPVATRILPAFVGPAGLDSTLQPFIARNAVTHFRAYPGATTLTGIGVALTATGTATAQGAFATTNIYTSTAGIEFLVTTAATTAVAGFRAGTSTATMPYWRGNAAGLGGFHVVMRFGPATGISTTSGTHRMFCGMQSGTAAPTDVDPASLTNIIGVGYTSTDANWQILFNDGTGTATKVNTGIVKPSADRANRYEVAIFCKPNGTDVTVQFSDLTPGGSSFISTNSSDLPSNTTFLGLRGYTSVGGTSSVVGFGLMSAYGETDT